MLREIQGQIFYQQNLRKKISSTILIPKTEVLKDSICLDKEETPVNGKVIKVSVEALSISFTNLYKINNFYSCKKKVIADDAGFTLGSVCQYAPYIIINKKKIKNINTSEAR